MSWPGTALAVLLLIGALFPVPIALHQLQLARVYFMAILAVSLGTAVLFNRSKLRPVSVLLPCAIACLLSAYELYEHGFCAGGFVWCDA